jgi:FkbM family methyltransferase
MIVTEINIGTDTLNKIWLSLGDEVSRKLFKARLNYSLLDDIGGFFKTKIDFCSEEDKQMIKNTLPNGGKKIAIYGAGVGGHYAWSIISVLTDDIIFIDNNVRTKSKWGVPVFSFADFLKFPDWKDYFIFISVGKPEYLSEITKSLDDKGITNYIPVINSQLADVGQFFNLHPDIKMRILFEPNSYPFKFEYFDLPELNFSKDKKEVFIDAGCFNGGTAIDFLKLVSSDSKVYSFEPNKFMYGKCQTNLKDYPNVKLFPYGLYNENTVLKFYQNSEKPSDALFVAGNTLLTGEEIKKTDEIIEVETKTLDSLVASGEISEKITFIKMDIEGSELAALKGAEKIIRDNKPRLAICIYHKPDDVWEIPEIILGYNPDYKLFVRHYLPFFTPGTIIYAV